jgi:hypothetical protein
LEREYAEENIFILAGAIFILALVIFSAKKLNIPLYNEFNKLKFLSGRKFLLI